MNARIPAPDRTRALERREHPLVRLLALAGLLVLWELVTRTSWVPALFLPSPLSVIQTGAAMLRSGELLTHVLTSLRRIGIRWGQGYHLARPSSLPFPRTRLASLTRTS